MIVFLRQWLPSYLLPFALNLIIDYVNLFNKLKIGSEFGGDNKLLYQYCELASPILEFTFKGQDSHKLDEFYLKVFSCQSTLS